MRSPRFPSAAVLLPSIGCLHPPSSLRADTTIGAVNRDACATDFGRVDAPPHFYPVLVVLPLSQKLGQP